MGAPRIDRCDQCGRVADIDLLDAEMTGANDPATVEPTGRLLCRECYGPKWLPMVGEN